MPFVLEGGLAAGFFFIVIVLCFYFRCDQRGALVDVQVNIAFKPDGATKVVAGGNKDGAAAAIGGRLDRRVDGFGVEGDAVAGGAEVFDVVDAGGRVAVADPGDELFGMVRLDTL